MGAPCATQRVSRATAAHNRPTASHGLFRVGRTVSEDSFPKSTMMAGYDPGTSGKSRATPCQNSSLLRRLATTKTSKKRFRKKSIFLGFGNRFFVIFPGFLRESAIFRIKINFLVKFCSRYTYSEVRATKNCEKTICAARTWPPRALPARALIYDDDERRL